MAAEVGWNLSEEGGNDGLGSLGLNYFSLRMRNNHSRGRIVRVGCIGPLFHVRRLGQVFTYRCQTFKKFEAYILWDAAMNQPQ